MCDVAVKKKIHVLFRRRRLRTFVSCSTFVLSEKGTNARKNKNLQLMELKSGVAAVNFITELYSRATTG